MPLYFSSHTTACLTKQALRELMKQLLKGGDGPEIRRCVASQIGGRILVESVAPDQRTLDQWFEARRVNCEWIMRIDLDGREGEIVEC
jgi:hypothetical protein